MGENIIREKPGRSTLLLAVDQLKNPLIIILLIAAGVTYFLGDNTDSVIIMAAVFINTVLGFVQEYKAQTNLLALKELITPTARVIRNGQTQVIATKDIKAGDLVIIKTGDRVPADGKLIEGVNLFINEAMLTGESEPVNKDTTGNNQLYSGAIVSSGRGQFKVEKIGYKTRLGQIAETLATTRETATPLQQQLSALAKKLAIVVLIICSLVFAIGVVRGQDAVTMFSLAVAIAVAATPEGMVVSLTVILSIGMQRILKRQALVRKLLAAETLGSVTTLCVDKTGTLTEGVMRVVAHKLTDVYLAVQTVTYANNLDNPIDLALWEWVQAQDHYDPQKMNDESPRKSEVPFDSQHKYMSVTNASGTWVKGAAEIVLELAQASERDSRVWTKEINELAGRGLRVIGLCRKSNTDKNWKFVGVLGVSDAVRAEVKDAIRTCEHAGIQVKVVTGDYRATSEAIMKQVGLLITDARWEIMEGKELGDLTAAELQQRVGKIKLFCRVTPEQKLKIVEALEAEGETVAMTGDGVNDALALKKAAIGIVVAGAADVARETADLVLLDSNFKTIVAAIEEGRVMFLNIRKVVLYLLSDALTEIILIVTAILIDYPLPLIAIQILWINILSDGLPNLALAFEPKEYDVMRRLPRSRQAPIINRKLSVMTFVLSISKAILAFAVFELILGLNGDLMHARTLVFAIVGSGSLMYVFSTRNLSKLIITDNPLKNPWLVGAVAVGFGLQTAAIYHPGLRGIFQSYPLTANDWLVVAGCGILLIMISEITKRMLTNAYRLAS